MAFVACNRYSRRRPATPFCGNMHRDTSTHTRPTALPPPTFDLSTSLHQTPRGRRPRLGLSSFNTTPTRLSSSQGSLESASSSNSTDIPSLCATLSLSTAGLSLPEEAPPALRRVPRTGPCRRPNPNRPSPFSATSVSLASSQLSDMAADEHRCLATPSSVVCVSRIPTHITDERVRAWLSDSPRPSSSAHLLSCFGRRRRHPSDDVEPSAAVLQRVLRTKQRSKKRAGVRRRNNKLRVLRFMGFV